MPQQRTGEAHGFSSSKLSVLRKHPIFADLEPEAFEQLCRYAKHSTLKRGATLFSKGDPGNSLYAVISGTVKMSISSPDGRNAILNIDRAWRNFRRDRAARRAGPLDRRHRKQQLRTLRHRPARIHPLCEEPAGAGDEIHRIALRAVAIDQRSGRADHPAESAGTAGQCAASPVRKAQRSRRRAGPSRSPSRRSARWSA